MNIKDKRKVTRLMSGISYETGDVKSIELSNICIAGNVGTGVKNVINNIILNLITYNSPFDLGIEILSTETYPWENPNRCIPHFVNQLKDVTTNEQIFTRLAEIAYTIHQYEGYLKSNVDKNYVDKTNIIILELNKEMFTGNESVVEQRRNILAILTKLGPIYGFFFIIVVREPDDSYADFVDVCRHRLVTRLPEEYSNKYLKCNIAAMEDSHVGFIWSYDVTKPYRYEKLKIKYVPNSYIGNICKLQSKGRLSKKDFYIKIKEELSIDENKKRQMLINTLILTNKLSFPFEYYMDKTYYELLCCFVDII